MGIAWNSLSQFPIFMTQVHHAYIQTPQCAEMFLILESNEKTRRIATIILIHLGKTSFISNYRSILQGQLCMLKSIVENCKISIAFHGIRVIKSKLSLINIQCFLLINGCLNQENQVSILNKSEVDIKSQIGIIWEHPQNMFIT